MIERKNLIIGLVIFFANFLFHLAIINDYPVSWDYHFHYYGGLYHLGLSVPAISEKPPVPFTPPDPRATVDDPFGPLLSVVPALSQIIFHEKLNILPFDSAYNLTSVITGSAGPALLFILLSQEAGIAAGLAGALFLSFFPYHFGHLHFNMKDVPNAFFFALSVYLFRKLVQTGKKIHLLMAAAAFAIAFNIKINSVIIPVIAAAWFLFIKKGKIFEKKYNLILSYFIAAPAAAIFLWWPFWSSPMGKLLEIPQLFSVNTIGMPVLYAGEIFYSCKNIPLAYPYGNLMVITPVIILISFMAGIFITGRMIFKGNKFSTLLILWFFIPLARYLHPKVCAIDGVRHFMEVLYPYLAIAAIGFTGVVNEVGKRTKIKNLSVWTLVLAGIILGYNIVRYHPYEASYFSPAAGGIKGASKGYDAETWGTSLREAAYWLNENAPANSEVNIVMAQSTAALYLRQDLLEKLNTADLKESDFTVVLNRKSFFPMLGLEGFVREKTAAGKTAFVKSIDGVPLFWIFGK